MQCETLHHETKENLPVFLGFLLGYVFAVSTKGSGGGRSVLNWNLDSKSSKRKKGT